MTTTTFKAPKGYESYKTAAERLGISVAQMRNAMNNRAEFKVQGAIITVAVEGYDAQFKYMRSSVVDRYQRNNAEALKRRGPRKPAEQAPAHELQAAADLAELTPALQEFVRSGSLPETVATAERFQSALADDHPDDTEY